MMFSHFSGNQKNGSVKSTIDEFIDDEFNDVPTKTFKSHGIPLWNPTHIHIIHIVHGYPLVN